MTSLARALALVVAALTLAAPLAAWADAPARTPAASPTPPGGPPPTEQNGGTFSVSAKTDPAGNVTYQVNTSRTTSQAGGGGTTVSSRSGAARHSSCVGETPAQAGITFYANGMTLIPQYNGERLPLVGSVPMNANNDATAAGFNNLTQSNAVEYVVVCDGVPTGYGEYVPSTDPGHTGGGAAAGAGQLTTVAQSAEGTITMPRVAIATSPLSAGLVHLNTWFWATGYSGAPVVVTRNALGASIEVDATPTSYTWDFGDGTAPVQTSSLGVAWKPTYTPAKSTVDCNFDGTPVDNGEPAVAGAVTHCYTKTSPGFSVTLTFNLAVSYKVNGGPAIALPPIQRTATLSYPVDEINTVITAR